MHWTKLEGRRIAAWGFGREGRATLAWLRKRLPDAPLALFCLPSEEDEARAFGQTLRSLDVRTAVPDDGLLAAFDIVVKSPGISAYRSEILAARKRGTAFTSGTALWFAAHPRARTIAVTGTKGKSTTTAMIAHLSRSLGVRTALAGNIGLPLLELDGQEADVWAIELSSFQTAEAANVDLGVVTSLYEEHLDWHGSVEQYVQDKLRLADASKALLINGQQGTLIERTHGHPGRFFFGRPDGWHVEDGWIHRGSDRVVQASIIPAPGAHNALNACAALAAIEHMGLDAVGAAPALASFHALPHRLQPLGERDGITYINDSISTTPMATLAALETLQGKPVAVIVGGHDRGLDWHGFVDAVKDSPPAAIVCQGKNGPRIHQLLEEARISNVTLHPDLASAFEYARLVIGKSGTVLLSPGAPSFDQFKDYADRGRAFASMAGLELEAGGIMGLGIL
ncbi:UDP-N-acetylmuramoyl-L-alanine--D-glutamate ligase [Pinirhizobacter sp.]|jgi:UDP-N-acetylmuramoylalanine--D-glutamate ligase|uniref:UDP-N-acetylmuramoyl-L-alanine--D-glutamate ligase n=1 Tax=Pinirhizobacter sp. TaxID=2950432 RepID=UPI002F42D21F